MAIFHIPPPMEFGKKNLKKNWGNQFPQNDGGTSSPSLKNAKMKSKKMSPRHGNENMDMSMDKPIALNSAEGIRGPQLKNAKMMSKKMSHGMAMKI